MLKNKILNNASWIIIGKLGQSLCSFIVTMLTARCYGPSNFGLINYAASLLAFFQPIAMLGLDNIQVQELVEHEKEEGKIVGTTLTLSFVSSIFCYIFVIVFSSMTNINEKITIIVCALYSIGIFFQGTNLIGYWFQARYLSKFSSIINLFAYFLICAYKVYILISGKSIFWFAISNTMDLMLSFLMLYISYQKHGGSKLQFSSSVAKRMFAKSKYYILVNLMVVIFGQTDKVMLKLMVDTTATGFYSAAITCSNLVSFIYLAIIDSARPTIFLKYKKGEKEFENSMMILYAVITYLSVVICIGTVVFAPFIIHIIYGSAYDVSIQALRIVVWYIPFSYIGTVRNIWILAEGKQKWLTPINVVGALSNVILNLALIPVWGVNGAAVASLLTQVFTNIVVSNFIPETRRSIILLFKSLNPKYIIETLEGFITR